MEVHQMKTDNRLENIEKTLIGLQTAFHINSKANIEHRSLLKLT